MNKVNKIEFYGDTIFELNKKVAIWLNARTAQERSKIVNISVLRIDIEYKLSIYYEV